MKPLATAKPKIDLECKILFNHNMRKTMRKWFRAEKKQGRQYLKNNLKKEMNYTQHNYCVHFPELRRGCLGFYTIKEAYDWAINSQYYEDSIHFEIGDGYYDPMNPEWLEFHSLHDSPPEL